MPEISPKAFREWIAVIAALLALLSTAGHYLVSASPNSPAIAIMQNELDRNLKSVAELQSALTQIHEAQAVMEKDFERRLQWLERDQERRR